MAKALMIQGTGSGAGKSLITTALCRIFRDMDINVAPFKAQNMALNSYVTAEGGEIGRAQVLQAEAARIKPEVHMNPILLKASGERGSQVIIHGKVYATMKAMEYFSFKNVAWNAVRESYDKLSQRFDFIIIEGAGSPAEINLMDVDIVNMSVAKYAKAPVILVGDIDKGGVFASLYGTVKLLGRDSKYIRAFIINKFRGDLEILSPGLKMISNRTGKPVIGVLPYVDIGLPEEDGLMLGKVNLNHRRSAFRDQPRIKIVVVKLQYISNFTDFDPFMYEPDVDILYSINPADIESADMVIIPGSKNTVKDLIYLKEMGIDKSIKRAYEKGIEIMGMCGGYQMLGKKIYDPHTVESNHREIEGIGLLNIETVFHETKITSQVEAKIVNEAMGFEDSLTEKPNILKGYEIHMGISQGDINLFKIRRLNGSKCSKIIYDGSRNENCWGTYIHGIFENDSFRRAIINKLRKLKNLSPIESTLNYSKIKDMAIDYLANIVKENIDMDFIKRLVRL